jgi:hypothetical protein
VSHHLLSAAPVLLGGAVRPPLNPLTAAIGLGGLALGAWLAWIGLFFDRPTRAPRSRSLPPTAPESPTPSTEARPEPDRSRAVV